MTHLRQRFTEKVLGKGRLGKRVKARQERKRKAKEEREKQFRKGFVHKGSEPKSFEVKPDLPTRGKRKRRFFY